MAPQGSQMPDPALVGFPYGRARHGLSSGRLAFDFLFGVLCPVAILVADRWSVPPLFYPTRASPASLPAYWAAPSYVVGAVVELCLVVWLAAGPRRAPVGLAVAGLFAFAALLSVGLGVSVVAYGLVHADSLSGLLALTPWVTTFVFARNCVSACRAGSWVSAPLVVLSLLLGVGVPLVAYGSVLSARERRARELEARLFSTRLADHQRALDQLQGTDAANTNRIARAYAELDPDDPRRPRIREAYFALTGDPIDLALRRLDLRGSEPVPDDEEREKEEPASSADRAQALLDQLFSTNPGEHKEALDALIDLQVLSPRAIDARAIVRRYRRLPEDDIRRLRIEAAYRQLAREPIEHGLQRLERKERGTPKSDEPTPPQGVTSP